jgi:simple sugar transport system permease protein
LDAVALLIAATLNAGTPLALAALGLLLNEKAGVVNLGAEGILLMAAVAGFAVAFGSGSPALGLAAGAAVGAAMAGLLGVLVIWLNTNQYATGLAISLFGGGLSAFAGLPYVGKNLPPAPVAGAGALRYSWLGPALFRQSPWSTSPSRSRWH